LFLDIPESLPIIYGNADMLLQTLSNLLSNACRHTRNGTISIYARSGGGVVTVAVCDDGEGIEAERIPFLFTRGISTRGTGYGLTICKNAIEAHGGDIRLLSDLGKGTAVTFTIPAL
jgi:signal transduction histidine kinase